MAHTLKRITFTTVILFFISIASVFGEEKKDETKKIQKKGCISQNKGEEIYNKHCFKPNAITKIKVNNNVLEYTWIKNNSCSNTNVVLDHELLEDSLNHSIRVVKINLKLIDKGGGLCAQQYYGEQEAHVDLSQKLKEVAKEYSLQPDKAPDSEGIFGFMFYNGQLHLVYRQPIIVELTLPTVTLTIE